MSAHTPASARTPERRTPGRTGLRGIGARVRGLALVALSALAAWCAPAAAQTDATELGVKLKLTLALARYVEWPPGAVPAGTLRLCVAQRSPELARVWAEAEGRTVAGRTVQLQLRPPFDGCHVLFVHASVERGSELLKAVRGQPVLTLGDAAGFAAQGGIVEFVPVNDTIRFDLNTTALAEARLDLPSQVMKMARQQQR